MAWITREGDYLVEGQRYHLYHGAESIRDHKGSFLQPAKFYLIENKGNVRSTFSEPIYYSIEDELGVTNIHVIVGDALYEYFWRQRDAFPEPKVSIKILLNGLRTIHDDEVPLDLGGIIAANENDYQLYLERLRAKA